MLKTFKTPYYIFIANEYFLYNVTISEISEKSVCDATHATSSVLCNLNKTDSQHEYFAINLLN